MDHPFVLCVLWLNALHTSSLVEFYCKSVGSRVRHYWQNGGMAPTSSPCPVGTDLGWRSWALWFWLVFSSPWLSWLKRNIKLLIVLERSMRRHKAFCSCAQRIIHKVNHWNLFKDFYKRVFQEWAHRPQLEAMGAIAICSLFVRKMFMAKEFTEFRA